MRSLEKIITYAVPCYNSSAYMDHCIQSILDSEATDIEIIIVDDGSVKDNTAEKADEWVAKYPDIIRCIHQENKGHGGACMAALKAATGYFFKVVDSDDWVDNDANKQLLNVLRKPGSEAIDLLITNYVIENEWENTQVRIDYRKAFKHVGSHLCGWDDMGHLGYSHPITMHAMTYRRQLLLDCNLELPEHTYYVDTIYAYVPLPKVTGLMYLDIDLYRYFVGRADQSTNVQNIVRRIDEHIKVTKIIISAYELDRDIPIKRLRKLMYNTITVLMCACTAYSLLSTDPSAHTKRMDVWMHLHDSDITVYKKIRRQLLWCGSNYPGTFGNFLFKIGYRVARKLFKFT